MHESGCEVGKWPIKQLIISLKKFWGVNIVIVFYKQTEEHGVDDGACGRVEE